MILSFFHWILDKSTKIQMDFYTKKKSIQFFSYVHINLKLFLGPI
jgi:hypothetical protein